MKIINSIKGLIAGCCVLGMTSCLDNEVDFGLASYEAYIIQSQRVSGEDTIFSFQPYFVLQANEELESASIKRTGSLDTYPLRKLYNTTYLLCSDLDDYMYPVPTRDTIYNGPYNLYLKSQKGEERSFQPMFDTSVKNRLGYVKADIVEFKGSENNLTMQWNAVSKASLYYITVEVDGNPYRIGAMLSTTDVKDKENVKSATINLGTLFSDEVTSLKVRLTAIGDRYQIRADDDLVHRINKGQDYNYSSSEDKE